MFISQISSPAFLHRYISVVIQEKHHSGYISRKSVRNHFFPVAIFYAGTVHNIRFSPMALIISDMALITTAMSHKSISIATATAVTTTIAYTVCTTTLLSKVNPYRPKYTTPTIILYIKYHNTNEMPMPLSPQ